MSRQVGDFKRTVFDCDTCPETFAHMRFLVHHNKTAHGIEL